MLGCAWGDASAKRLTHREERRLGDEALRVERFKLMAARGWDGVDWWRIGRDECGEVVFTQGLPG